MSSLRTLLGIQITHSKKLHLSGVRLQFPLASILVTSLKTNLSFWFFLLNWCLTQELLG